MLSRNPGALRKIDGVLNTHQSTLGDPFVFETQGGGSRDVTAIYSWRHADMACQTGCPHTGDLHAGAPENARRADLERVKDFHKRNEGDGLCGDINGLVPRREDARDDAVQQEEQYPGDDCCFFAWGSKFMRLNENGFGYF